MNRRSFLKGAGAFVLSPLAFMGRPDVSVPKEPVLPEGHVSFDTRMRFGSGMVSQRAKAQRELNRWYSGRLDIELFKTLTKGEG